MAIEETSSLHQLEPLSPASCMFHSPGFNCHIIAILGSKCRLSPTVIKAGLERTLVKHPRFNSKLVVETNKRKTLKWKPIEINLENHVIIPELDQNMDSPDQFIENYISYLTTFPMDLSKPLWELHLLNIETADAEAVAVFKIHHSLGDGASLISLLLACTRKESNPEELPTVPTQKRAGLAINPSGGIWWFFLAIWMAMRTMWNTLVDSILFIATMLFFKDINPLIGASGVELKPKRFVHRTVSFDDIKLIKNSLFDITVNDVILGITQAGLSRYLNRRYDKDGVEKEKNKRIPKSIRVRATVLVNLRPTVGIETLADLMAKESNAKWGWGNWIGYILLPFKIGLKDNPLDYIREAKAIMDRKKLSVEAISTSTSALLAVKSFGVKAAVGIARRVVSNTTLAFSSVVGPLEDINFYGHQIAYIAPSIYGQPQALSIHFQSYCNKMTIVLAVDPDVIPDPHQLCDDLVESLKTIKDVAVGTKFNVV